MTTLTQSLLLVLRKARRPLPTSEVAHRVGSTRRVVLALLGRLARRGVVVRVRRGGGRGRQTLWGVPR